MGKWSDRTEYSSGFNKMAGTQLEFASVFMSPKKWRQVEQWAMEVGKHLSEGTLTMETISVISKEYKMGDEPLKGAVRSTYETQTSLVTIHGYQPTARPSSAASNTTSFRPRSSLTNHSSSKPESSPSVAVVRPSPIRTPAKTEISRPNSSKDTGSSTGATRPRRCCCCCSNGSMTANASTPGGWVSPSVANTLQVNRNRAVYNHPVKSPIESTPYDTRAYKLTYQHAPTNWKPEIDPYARSNGYPPWVTGASVVISANQMRSNPHIAYRPMNGTEPKWNGTRWVTETSNSKIVPAESLPVH